MSSLTLHDVLACPSLPTLPKVAMDVLEMSRDPEVEVMAIADVVQYDPALTSKILKTVNSSYYGLASPCPTIGRAVGLLGLDAIRTLVLGFALTEVTSNDSMRSFDIRDFWRRSIYAAAAARHFAGHVAGCDPEQSFTAALLQDIGMLAIHTAATDSYQAIVGATRGDHARLVEVESSRLQFTHAQAGASLAEHWRLPETLIEPIRLHHPGPDEISPDNELARLVRLAFRVGHLIDDGQSESALTDLWLEAQDWFELPIEAVNTVLRNTGRDAKELASLFEVEIGEFADMNAILAAADEARIALSFQLSQQASELRTSNAALTRQAHTDGLTGVANRARFDQQFESLFDTARNEQTPLGLVFVDADHFKQLNDTHGHPAGDAVLRELASRLQRTAGDGALVCRYGGEEFAIILDGASLRDAATVAERVRVAVEAMPFDLSDTGAEISSVDVTVSLGVAALDHEQGCFFTSASRLLKCADKALYAAKESGRNCARVARARKAA